MRFFLPIASIFAAVAVAQSTCSQNCILVPNGGLNVVAGESITLTISNPSPAASGLIIKLQQGTDITPNSGVTLASNVDPTSGTITVKIPNDLPASNQYTFETIDAANPTVINFSPPFAIAGATGVSSAASSTGTSASTASSATNSSDSSSTTDSSSSTRTSSMTRTSSESMTRTSSSASSTATTSAPNSNTNGASSLKVESALIALIAGAIAAF